MRAQAITTLLLSSAGICSAVRFAELLRFSSSSSTLSNATPGSTPNTGLPVPTVLPGEPKFEKMDLRRSPPVVPVPNAPAAAQIGPAAQAPANPANPAAAPVQPAAPGNPLVPPALAADPQVTTTASSDDDTPKESVTVQWLETWIGGTEQTWVPKTITFHFDAFISEAQVASPGSGQIGMGTLTGQVGVTKTIVAAAPTRGVEWVGGVVAVGVGLAGVL